MFLTATLVLFAAFFLNLLWALAGQQALLGEVGEMLLLLATVLCFVITILQKEAEAGAKREPK